MFNLLSNLFSGLVKKIIYAVLIVVGGSYLINYFDGNGSETDPTTTNGEEQSIGQKIGSLVDDILGKTKEVVNEVKEKSKHDGALGNADEGGMVRICNDDELDEIRSKTGFPASTDDVQPLKGTYVFAFEGDQILFKVQPGVGGSQPVVGTMSMYSDGELNGSLLYVYCGGSIYALIKDTSDIGKTPVSYIFMKPGAESMVWAINGETFVAEYQGRN